VVDVVSNMLCALDTCAFGQISKSPRVSPKLPINIPFGGTETPYDAVIGTNQGGERDCSRTLLA